MRARLAALPQGRSLAILLPPETRPRRRSSSVPDLLFLVSAAAGLIAAGFLLGAAFSLRRLRWLAAGSRLTLALLLASLAALSAGLVVSTHGYRALTREDVAAVVHTDPLGPQAFRARIEFPDGEESSFLLRGDELYLDARILKWTPVANLLGLHTSYEFDRVAGRYTELRDERDRPRTVFSLVHERPLDLFSLRRRFPQLRRLLDAEYGSATFAAAREPASYEVRISTTGLLLRPLSREATQADPGWPRDASG